MIKKTRCGANLAFVEFFVSCGVALREWENEPPRGRHIYARGKVARSCVTASRLHDRASTARRITRSVTRALHLRRRVKARRDELTLRPT
jgi:hypothetical protein